MGFNLGGALGGGLSSFLMSGGNPVAAAGGAVAGGMGNSSGRVEGGVQQRDWNQNERGLLQALFPQLQAGIGGMGAADQEALLSRLYGAAFDPAARQINQAYTRVGSQQDARNLLRGTGPSTTMLNQQTRRLGQQSADLADASNRATLMAEQGLQGRLASNRADMSGLLGLLGQLDARRLGTATRYEQTPGLGLSESMSALGGALGDPSSPASGWINDLFGGA